MSVFEFDVIATQSQTKYFFMYLGWLVSSFSVMEIDSSDKRKIDWVADMKKGTFIPTLDDGNCALYSLAMYFSVVFAHDGGIEDYFSKSYKVETTDGWCDPFKRGTANENTLFTKAEVNRVKMVKIFQCAVKRKTDAARGCLAQDSNGSTAHMENFPANLKIKRWKGVVERSTDAVKHNSSGHRLAIYFTLYEMLEEMNCGGLNKIEGEHKQDLLQPEDMEEINKTVRDRKFADMDLFYNHVLTSFTSNYKWMTTSFIKEVIEQVRHDYQCDRQVDVNVVDTPWIFCEKSSEHKDDPFRVIFSDLCFTDKQIGEHNKQNKTGKPKSYSPIMFVHLPGHYGLVFSKSMLSEDFDPGPFKYLKPKQIIESNFIEFTFGSSNTKEDEIEIPDDTDDEHKGRKRAKTNASDSICELGGAHEITRAILQRMSF